MKLSVLMPVYNEVATLEEILRRVRQVPIEKEIIIVDNISTDGTREFLSDLVAHGKAVWADEIGEVRVAFQTQNNGKGASVRRALDLARGDWIVVQDADLEYDPNDYLKLLALAEKPRRRHVEAIFGTRLLRGSQTRANQPRTAFYYGRVGLSVLFRVLYGVPVSDVATCYKLMRRDTARSLNLRANGFDLDFEIAAKLARRGIRIWELGVSYAPRTVLEGKKIHALHDGLRAAWTLWKYRFVS
ncbi:MAG TPA: glycosyltransferase family 2 protein [Abditibacteriaceae bacterium]|jgi:glycosyltransferase involved in cell wall biosynthesis